MDVPTPLLVAASVAAAIVLAGPVLRLVLRRRHHDALAADLSLLTWPVRCSALALFASVATHDQSAVARAVTGLALALAVAWALLRALRVVQEVWFRQLEIDVSDNLRARSRRTQIELLRRVVSVVVVVGAVLVVLLAVTPVGELGPSIVAYASLIGVVLGIALRAPLESLASGIIVAVSEPIRIDDVVVIEGQWGRVQQIGLGQVVVRLWDDRRLVLPTARFVNEPFENWTHSSSDLTGTVTMWLDYTVDVDEVRAELDEIVHRSPLWDGRALVLQVVDLGERAVQLRALVTARNAGDLWDLRCHVREALLDRMGDRRAAPPVVRIEELAVPTFGDHRHESLTD